MDDGPDRGSGTWANQPELLLVDLVLAEQARRLLPDVLKRPRPAAPRPPPAVVLEPAPVAPPESPSVAIEPAVPCTAYHYTIVNYDRRGRVPPGRPC